MITFLKTNYIGLVFLIFLLFTFVEKKEDRVLNLNIQLILLSSNVFLYITIEQYFSFFNIIFITVLIIKNEVKLPSISLAPIFLTSCICMSYLGFTSVTNTLNIESDKCFDETSIQQIQNYVSKEDVVMTKPSIDCFRRDTKRSQIFSFGFLPYNIEQGNWYLNKLSEFENWKFFSTK